MYKNKVLRTISRDYKIEIVGVDRQIYKIENLLTDLHTEYKIEIVETQK